MSLKRILKEFSNLDNSYKYRRREEGKFNFTTDDNIEYDVVIFKKRYGEGIYEVGFDSNGGYIGMSSPKAKNPYKVFNTVFNIVNDFYKKNKNDIEAFLIHAGKKRKKIYKYYINKLFPSATIEDDGYDPNAFIVKFD